MLPAKKYQEDEYVPRMLLVAKLTQRPEMSSRSIALIGQRLSHDFSPTIYNSVISKLDGNQLQHRFSLIWINPLPPLEKGKELGGRLGGNFSVGLPLIIT